MAFKIVGTTSAVEVDSHTDKALLVNKRAPAIGSLGAYSGGTVTGAITATLGAASNLFYFRWTDATRFAVIERIAVNAVVVSAVTTSVPFDLAVFFGTGFTVAPSANQTAATITGRNMKRRTSFGTTLVSGIFSCTTAGMTGATIVLDTQPLARICGTSGTAVNTQFFSPPPVELWRPRDSGDYPLVLAQNEGLVIQNPLAGPATGTFACSFTVAWNEVAAY